MSYSNSKIQSWEELFQRITPKGYVPPQDVPLERSVLGVILIDKASAEKAFQIIGARTIEDSPFYHEAHKFIYLAAFELFTENEAVDLATVTNRLRRQDKLDSIGGPVYLHECATMIVTTVNIVSHCNIVLEKYYLRELIRIAEMIKLRGYIGMEDSYELIAKAAEELLELQALFKRKQNMVLMSQAIDEALAQLHKQAAVKGLYGLPTGIGDLDDATDGWQKGDLIILAARPSQGKTALALNTAIASAAAGHKVGFFSLEMNKHSLIVRMLANLGQLSQKHLNKLNFDGNDWYYFDKAVADLRELGIYLDDSSGISPFDFRARATDLVLRKGVELLIVDYLQLMTPGVKKQSRDLEIGHITGSLKATAKDLDVPVIALSQLNRSVEARTGKFARPRLSDLRESGNIENDADVVIFPWNPNPDAGSEKPRTDGLGELYELIIAKQRKGAAGQIIDARFIKELSKFVGVPKEEQRIHA